MCVFFLSRTALDESLLDALGILPRRKRHKKLLLVCHSRFDASLFTLIAHQALGILVRLAFSTARS